MPDSASSVSRLAKKEGWTSRTRQQVGGGLEYHVTNLPPAARKQLATTTAPSATDNQQAGKTAARKNQISQSLDLATDARKKQAGLAAMAVLSGEPKARATARLEILGALDRYQSITGINISTARKLFAATYNEGGIAVSTRTQDIISDISARSLDRWAGALTKNGAAALAGDYGNRTGSSKIDQDPELKDFVLGMITERPHCSPKQVLTAIKARFNSDKAPAIRSLQRWMNRWKEDNAELFTAVSNPDAWKNKYMYAFGDASGDIARLNQRWEFDSTPADIMLTDGRHNIIGVIDVYSRRVKMVVSRTSKASAVASLIRHTILEWGVPEEAKTDNGADYVSEHIKRVFTGLEVTQTLCTPYQAWEKPHIERFFHTFSHGLLELVNGYIGHNVEDRNAIESRRSFADRLLDRNQVVDINLTADELQTYCDRWVTDLYHHEPHAGLNGKTPFEITAASTDQIRAISNQRALDLLLAEAPTNKGIRTVGKKGIRVDSGLYIAIELGRYSGEQVAVRYDPEDYGVIYVYSLDGTFICLAEDPTVTGANRKEIAAIAKTRQREAVQKKRKELKRIATKQNVRDIAEEVLNHAHSAHNVTAFPQPTTPHQSAGMEAAAEAALANQIPSKHTATPVDDQAHQASVAQFEQAEQANQAEIVNHDDDRRRYAHWLRLDRRVQAQHSLKPAEWEFHTTYKQTTEHQSMRKFFSAFDLTADDFQ